MTHPATSELHENYLFFQRSVAKFVNEHRGQYALLHAQSVIAFFDKPIEAALAGASQFPDGKYSVQKVTDRPADLGFMAYGAGDRNPD